MKKILALFTGIFLFVGFLSSPPKVLALCTESSQRFCTMQFCGNATGLNCCTTQAECANPQAANNANKISADAAKCDNGSDGIQTAIGCVPALTDTNVFFAFILRWAVGVGSGISFLLMLYAGFMIMSSSGNPERLKAGQELLTSAIAGLILLIFSVFILKFIGIDILGLGAFGFGK